MAPKAADWRKVAWYEARGGIESSPDGAFYDRIVEARQGSSGLAASKLGKLDA
jgi:hypothetical protein